MSNSFHRHGVRLATQLPLMLALLLALPSAWPATTDLADVPLFTSSSSTVKPNIMFVLDDSGSMASDYMPDDANFAKTKYGFYASQCNGLAYNPATTYTLPVDDTGVAKAAGSTSFTNPNNRITTNYVVSTSPVTIVATGDVTVAFPSSPAPANNWFTVGGTATIFSSTDTVKFMEGAVKSWDTNTRTLVVTVTTAVGTGSNLTNVRAGMGNAPFYFTYTPTGSSYAPMSYTYTASGVDKTTPFYAECDSAAGSNAKFTKFVVTSASSDLQNYANWKTYYSTRILMAKSALSLSFKNIGDRYRVGFSTISAKTASGTKFLDIDTFDATQKKSFYDTFYAANTGSNTPLRGALSKAGQYFANKAPSQTKDPVQYACQKNFTILSTDGYWNTGTESTTYGPFDLAGNKVGQQDGAPTDRPMRDSSVDQTTTVTKWTSTRTLDTQLATTKTTYTGVTQTQTTAYNGPPAATGKVNTTYTGFVALGSSARCGGGSNPCVITVTATNHGFASGQSVTIVGAAPSGYNGTFTVTKINNNTFTYSVSPRPASNSTPGYALPASSGALSCPSGSGAVTKATSQTDTFPSTVTTTINATATATTSYTLSRTVTATPYTQTVVVTNGATTSDTTVAGTPTVTGPTTLTPPADSVTTLPYTASSSAAGTAKTVTTNASGLVCTNVVVANTTNVTTTVVAATPAGTSNTGGGSLAAVTSPTVTTTPNDQTVVGTKTSSSTSAAINGSSNSLADIAMYYNSNDLRTPTLGNCTGALGSGTDVCKSVTADGTDANLTQNMVTYTLGLGVDGTLKYDPNYLKQTSGDFFDLKQGTKNWPIPTDSTNGGDPTNIDDLWHAAVNGRGQYFSAKNPQAVVTSLDQALLSISEKIGASSAAATSTLQPIQGDNDVFVAQFTSGKWIGDVKRYSINPSDGSIITSGGWSAGNVLDTRIAAGSSARMVYYFKKGSGNTGSLRQFTYSNLQTDSLNANFDSFCSKTGSGGGAAPGQCATLNSTDLATANSGANLVSYLLGNANSVYRSRDSALGDIINSSPIYVGAPKFKYTENSYANFASANATRQGVVYVGANDGMLHAFKRETGEELWAYVPAAVLPNLYKLADTDFAYNHQYYVDGAPQVGDVWNGTEWRTILVGGLNKGGRSYYALDITNPTSPTALWEFSDTNLGLTFGNPIITKRKDGTWVVAFASGYNNVSSGDGNGYLYVVNAFTGAKLAALGTYTSGTTPAGTTSTPSGLSKINAYVASEIDNTAKLFYGGDLLGNVWRFDVDSNVAPFGQSFLLAQLMSGGKPQPITTRPELADVNYLGSTYAVVYIGTGKYLGTGDLSNSDQQSVFAIKDAWSTTGLGDVRASNTLVAQTISTPTGQSYRTITSNAVNWSAKNGWMVDLPSSGERVNVNMILALNVLSVASNIPSNDVCDAGGRSWLYKFDIGTGAAVSNAVNGAVGISLGNVLVAGQTVVQLSDGSTVTISTLSDTTLRTDSQPPPPPTATLRRTSWRELAN